MIKIDVDKQSKKINQKFIKKSFKYAIILAFIFIFIGVILSIIPQEQPQQIIQTPPAQTEIYDVSLDLLQSPSGVKYLKITNIGRNIVDARDLIILSYPPEQLITYGLPACSVSTNDFDFIDFNKDDSIYYYYNSNSETMHISKTIPDFPLDLIDGRWRFDIIVNGNVINSKLYDITDSKLKICNTEDNLASIIKKASAYDTILVTGEEYYERLQIDQPITLKSKNNTIINGGNIDNTINIDSDNVYISGFELKNSGMSLYDAAIHSLYHKNVTISICIFNNNANGIYIEFCSDFKIYNNLLSDNTGSAIYLDHSTSNLIRSNTMHNNNNGIYLIESDLNYIKENSVNNNNEYGIFIEKYGAFDNVCEYNYWGNDDCYCNKIITQSDAIIFQNDPNSICGRYSKDENIIINEWNAYKSDNTEKIETVTTGFYNF